MAASEISSVTVVSAVGSTNSSSLPFDGVLAERGPAGPVVGGRDARERLRLDRRDRADQQLVVRFGEVEDGDVGAPVVAVGPDRDARADRHP